MHFFRSFRLFLVLTVTFFGVGIAGCLLHECGHALVAKLYGDDAVRIHYDSTSFGRSPADKALDSCLEKQPPAETGKRMPPAHPCRELARRVEWESSWVTAAGPLCNMLIGSLGFGLILANRRSFLAASRLRAAQWALVFLSFFWSRQLLNFAADRYISLTGHVAFDDESGLALSWGWPRASLSLLTALIGLVLMSIVTFRYIPRTQRLPFILAGVMGGALCYWLWLFVIGPVLMP